MYQPQPPNLKEIRTHGTKSFPCAIYRTRSFTTGTLVKHHWHDEAEILYFSEGQFSLEINMEQFPVRSECLYFINPGELHSISIETADSYEDAVVFSPGILNFDCCDTAQLQLIRPIQEGKLLFPRCILPSHPSFPSIRSAFTDILHSFGQTGKGRSLVGRTVTDDLASQLFIKSSLLHILAGLLDQKLFIPAEKSYDKRVEDIKTILTYIRDNYKEKIRISDLAEQISLNEQYFCRYFKKAIGRSPMAYVNEYRIKQSLRLLTETDLAVMDICLECGYGNLGNFLREFRKYTNTTPLQYRKQKS